MSTLTKLYEEIQELKARSLVCDIRYEIHNAKRADLPYTYHQVIVLTFLPSIEDEKIIRVRDYIEHVYGQKGLPVEQVEMRSSHVIKLYIIKSRETVFGK
jgi:hypothetical protein